MTNCLVCICRAASDDEEPKLEQEPQESQKDGVMSIFKPKVLTCPGKQGTCEPVLCVMNLQDHNMMQIRGKGYTKLCTQLNKCLVSEASLLN